MNCKKGLLNMLVSTNEGYSEGRVGKHCFEAQLFERLKEGRLLASYIGARPEF